MDDSSALTSGESEPPPPTTRAPRWEGEKLETIEANRLVLLQATLEAARDAVMVEDLRGTVVLANSLCLELWGVTRQELVGISVNDVWTYASRKAKQPGAFLVRIDEALAAGGDPSDIVELVDGRIFEFSSRPLRVSGELAGRAWYFSDVTERYRADIVAHRLAAIVASSDDAIIGKDLESRITSWNDGAERIFGYTAGEMIGNSIMRLIPDDRQDEERDILDRLRRGVRIDHFETVRVRKDGRKINVSITVSPIKDALGNVVGASKVARDISREKQSDLELLKAVAEAEKANRERLVLLESEREARAQAERTSRLKDEFLATLSHELRTPLNAILGWTAILGDGTSDAAEVLEGVQTIERNARAQARLIEDLLEMSRIISGKVRLDIRPLNINDILDDAMATVRAAAEGKGIRLESRIDTDACQFSGDANRLQQVFWNLLNNAIKFTPRGGWVRVRLRRVDSQFEISVTDTGEGIASEFLPFVFDRFKQADASITRRHGGLGLGLAIVKQLTELHGGTVSVSSAGLGRGATFSIRLPISAIAEETEPDPHREQAPAIRPNLRMARLDHVRVLAVDDEPDARRLVQRLLESAGAEVATAGSVSEAMDQLTKDAVDVIVCDIGMPGEDGYSFLRRLRASDEGRLRRVPAVALTAYARAEDRIRALDAGFQNHVAKPVESAELLAIVRNLAGKTAQV